MAIRRNGLRAAALGVPVHARLIAIYTLAAAYAGAAGALLAQTTGYVSLEVLEFQRSADVLLALIIGGVGWLYGGIAGAVAFKLLQDVLSTSSPQFWMLWMGLFLVALALLGRERLAAGVRGMVARAWR
jgi:branched-chain amino acid transport system permease protein